jgi:hypothetical protein
MPVGGVVGDVCAARQIAQRNGVRTVFFENAAGRFQQRRSQVTVMIC